MTTHSQGILALPARLTIGSSSGVSTGKEQPAMRRSALPGGYSMFLIRFGIATSLAVALLAPALFAQAVAFQPVVGSLPSGPILNTTPAISLDRRYVRLGINAQFIDNAAFSTYNVPAAVGGGAERPGRLGRTRAWGCGRRRRSRRGRGGRRTVPRRDERCHRPFGGILSRWSGIHGLRPPVRGGPHELPRDASRIAVPAPDSAAGHNGKGPQARPGHE